jgi:hypothetical protein
MLGNHDAHEMPVTIWIGGPRPGISDAKVGLIMHLRVVTSGLVKEMMNCGASMMVSWSISVF